MSVIKTNTLSTLDGVYTVPSETLARGACRAWVNFDGATSPGTILGSFNVSSVARNGTGDYTVNFTTAMPDANFACAALNEGGGATNSVFALRGTGGDNPNTTTSVRLLSRRIDTNALVNNSRCHVAIFR